MYHIAFCINNDWVMQCGVLIKSILKTMNKKFVFHIINKDISEYNKKLLNSVLDGNSSLIEYHMVPLEWDDKLVIRSNDRLTVETYYRFFIPALISSEVDRILYLDADILCLSDFEELFTMNIENFSCAMVEDCRANEICKYNRLGYGNAYGYYNAGVMLINLKYWRQNSVSERLINFVVENPEKCWAHDQDAINALLYGKIKKLSYKYNLQTLLLQEPLWEDLKNCPREIYIRAKIKKDDWIHVKEAIYAPCFVHFTELYKPWMMVCKTPYAKIWRFIYGQTIWSSNKLKRWGKQGSKFFRYRIKLFLKKIFFNDLDQVFPLSLYDKETEFLSVVR